MNTYVVITIQDGRSVTRVYTLNAVSVDECRGKIDMKDVSWHTIFEIKGEVEVVAKESIEH